MWVGRCFRVDTRLKAKTKENEEAEEAVGTAYVFPRFTTQ